MLFGIAGEYEGQVRWKKDAPAARDTFARTANNAKVGTQQVWQEAKQRKDELTDLVGGSSPFSGKSAEPKAAWKDVCDRSPLMQQIGLIWEPRLKPSLADKGQFTAASDQVIRDAEMMAAMGHVLAKDGMADADSDEYKRFCEALKGGAKAIVEGAKSKNYDAAAAGGAAIGRACTECHENYRA
jgi:cytochrome c556